MGITVSAYATGAKSPGSDIEKKLASQFNEKKYLTESQEILLNPWNNDLSESQVSKGEPLDQQIIKELDAEAISLGNLTVDDYRNVLNSTTDVRHASLISLKKKLEYFIDSTSIHLVKELLSENRKNGAQWHSSPLLQQIALELLAKWELDQLKFKATKKRNSDDWNLWMSESMGRTYYNAATGLGRGSVVFENKLEEAYYKKCDREQRLVEVLYFITNEELPAGIEKENAVLLLYHIFHGSLMKSSGCPMDLWRTYGLYSLPFGLPAVGQAMFKSSYAQLIGFSAAFIQRLIPEEGMQNAGFRKFITQDENNPYASRELSSHSFLDTFNPSAWIIWKVYGFNDRANSYTWQWTAKENDSLNKDSGLLKDSIEVLENWAAR